MVDTNSDPSNIDFPIPANDDATKSISLIVGIIIKAVQEGLDERKREKEDETEKEAAAAKAKIDTAESLDDAPKAESRETTGKRVRKTATADAEAVVAEPEKSEE